MTALLCMGEAMAEISRDGAGFAVSFAGDTFNTAVYARRHLPRSMGVAYLTRMGLDPLSQGFAALAASEGVDLSPSRSTAQRNLGVYAVETDARGERSFAYWRSESAARMLFDDGVDLAALQGAWMVYLSGITLAIISDAARAALMGELARLRAEHGLRVAFDSNYRPRLWPDRATAQNAIAAAYRLTDIALPSLDDEMALWGDADEAAVLQRLAGFGCTDGALKRGADGPVSLRGDVAQSYPPAPRVVDTTAAGDSFNGAYLAAILQGQPEAQALVAGHTSACHVIGHRGAIVPKGGA